MKKCNVPKPDPAVEAGLHQFINDGAPKTEVRYYIKRRSVGPPSLARILSNGGVQSQRWDRDRGTWKDDDQAYWEVSGLGGSADWEPLIKEDAEKLIASFSSEESDEDLDR